MIRLEAAGANKQRHSLTCVGERFGLADRWICGEIEFFARSFGFLSIPDIENSKNRKIVEVDAALKRAPGGVDASALLRRRRERFIC